MQKLALALIRLGRLDDAQRAVDRLLATRPHRIVAGFVTAELARARGQDAAVFDADLMSAAAFGSTVKVNRGQRVSILGIIGAHGLGDFIYQLLVLATLKRQFETAVLTLIYSDDRSYKADVLRFCPDLDRVLDYGGQSLNMPVPTKDWDEYRYHFIFPQPALSPTLLMRYARTASLTPPGPECERLAEALTARGVDPTRWFVTSHYRQSSTFPHLLASQRDVDGGAFHDLARYICEDLGGQVIRLGHKGMDPIPEIPGYIDLSAASLELQLFASSKARFMVGCDSGPAAYATAFKTPLLKTNTFSEDGVFYPHDLLLPKNIVNWKDEVLSLGGLMEDRLVFFKRLPLDAGAFRSHRQYAGSAPVRCRQDVRAHGRLHRLAHRTGPGGRPLSRRPRLARTVGSRWTMPRPGAPGRPASSPIVTRDSEMKRADDARGPSHLEKFMPEQELDGSDLVFDYKGRTYPTYLKGGNACSYIAAFAKEFCKGEGLDIGGYLDWTLPGARAINIVNNDGFDAYTLPEGLYDYIFSSHTLEHVADYVRALEGWKAHLKPGGVLFLYLPHPDMEYWLPQNNRKHLHLFYPADMEKLLRDIGFHTVIRSERDLYWAFSVVGMSPTP